MPVATLRRASSSIWQSNGLLIRRFGVRVPGGPPAPRGSYGASSSWLSLFGSNSSMRVCQCRGCDRLRRDEPVGGEVNFAVLGPGRPARSRSWIILLLNRRRLAEAAFGRRPIGVKGIPNLFRHVVHVEDAAQRVCVVRPDPCGALMACSSTSPAPSRAARRRVDRRAPPRRSVPPPRDRRGGSLRGRRDSRCPRWRRRGRCRNRSWGSRTSRRDRPAARTGDPGASGWPRSSGAASRPRSR